MLPRSCIKANSVDSSSGCWLTSSNGRMEVLVEMVILSVVVVVVFKSSLETDCWSSAGSASMKRPWAESSSMGFHGAESTAGPEGLTTRTSGVTSVCASVTCSAGSSSVLTGTKPPLVSGVAAAAVGSTVVVVFVVVVVITAGRKTVDETGFVCSWPDVPSVAGEDAGTVSMMTSSSGTKSVVCSFPWISWLLASTIGKDESSSSVCCCWMGAFVVVVAALKGG